MSEELDLLKRRFAELAKRSEQGYFTFTDFLGLAEQSAFNEIKGGIKGISYSAFGGAEGTERVMIRFGSPEELGYEEEFPIVTLMIKPKSEKFADRLTHRDFLGALMSLGIERSVLGDIVIRDNIGYLFAKEDIGAYYRLADRNQAYRGYRKRRYGASRGRAFWNRDKTYSALWREA